MKHVVKGKEIYDSIGFALSTISLETEYYWKGLDECGGAAPGLAAFANAMFMRFLVDENKWRRKYQTIKPSPGEMIPAAIPIQTRPSRCRKPAHSPY